MSFKYINPGYAELLSDQSASDVTATSAQSRTGKAFNCVSSGGTLYAYEIANNLTAIIPNDSGTEFWAKVDMYIPLSTNCTIYVRQNGGSGLSISFSYYKLTYFIGGTSIDIKSTNLNTFLNETNLKLDAINTVWLHAVLSDDSSVGYLEFKINNRYFGKYFGNTMPSGFTSSAAYLYKYFLTRASVSGVYFSSLIISDEYISPYERVLPLTVSSTVADMDSLESGLYVADNASETLLQSVNTTSLVNEYGSDAKVTGVALIGNPAYEVDDVIGSLTSITKQNGVVTDHDNITLL